MRSNLACVLLMTCFLLAIRTDIPMPFAAITQAQTEQSMTFPSEDVSPQDVKTLLPPETELVLLSSRRPNPVAPEGWRRTDQGWEHVSTWRPAARPLGEIIETQVDQEPAWMRDLLERLRKVPPLMFALIQITAIAAIVNVARNQSESEGTELRSDLRREWS